jgi:hypothetical protein
VFHAGPDAAQIDGVDAVEHVGGLVGGVGHRRLDAGVVVGQIEAAERLDCGGHRGCDLLLVGHVAAHGEHPVPGCGECPLSCRQCVGVDVGQCHRRAGLGEGPRRGQAHARAGAGDERDLPGEVVRRVHNFPFRWLRVVRR